MKQPNNRFHEGRFWTRILKKKTGCWIWQGAVNNTGYGTVIYRGKSITAHRLAWNLWGFPQYDFLELDHLCKVRNCINPKHLEPVTKKENMRRSNGASTINKKKTHCNRGHTYNRIQMRKGGKWQRVCSLCEKMGWERWKANKLTA